MNDRTTAFLASATAWQRATFATTYLTVAVVVCVPLWLAIRRRLRFDDDWAIALWVALHAVFASGGCRATSASGCRLQLAGGYSWPS